MNKTIETTLEEERGAGVRTFEVVTGGGYQKVVVEVRVRYETNEGGLRAVEPEWVRGKEPIANRDLGVALAQVTAVALATMGSRFVHAAGARGILEAGNALRVSSPAGMGRGYAGVEDG